MNKKAIATFSIIIVAAISLIVLIAVGSQIRKVNEGMGFFGNLKSWVFGESEKSDLIEEFKVEKKLGKRVMIQWRLDPVVEKDADFYPELYYWDSPSNKKPIELKGVTSKDRIHTLYYELPNYKDHTISLQIFRESEESLESEGFIDLEKVEEDTEELADEDEITVSFRQEMDHTTFTDFTGLIDNYIGYNLLEKGESEIVFPHYWLEKDYMVVGFSDANAQRKKCGFGSTTILRPPECAGKSCLCLCKGHSFNSCQKTYLCESFDGIDIVAKEPIEKSSKKVSRGKKIERWRDQKDIHIVFMGKCGVGKKWNNHNRDLKLVFSKEIRKLENFDTPINAKVIYIDIQ
ncbi:MAG: hypothetical protein MAG795_01006 [Candidatus Woesearchaeota archaeon]|nr:hypothetical protein [Candidatus Woesearchaeota archaeon]